LNFLRTEQCRLERSDVRDCSSVKRSGLHDRVSGLDLRLVHNCEKNKMRLDLKQRPPQTQTIEYSLSVRHRDCIRASDVLKDRSIEKNRDATECENNLALLWRRCQQKSGNLQIRVFLRIDLDLKTEIEAIFLIVVERNLNNRRRTTTSIDSRRRRDRSRNIVFLIGERTRPQISQTSRPRIVLQDNSMPGQ